MPYVRQRGNQVLIVHGERIPGTGKVEQHVLFTLYSQPEAREAIGGSASRFESLLEQAHPELRFDWKRIRKEIERLTAQLPERFDYDEARQAGRFREAMRAFARQLMLADPQHLIGSARLVKQNRHELAFLRELIDWRLQVCEQEESEWNQDNPFHWRFTLQGRDLPSDTEELLAGYWERRELERAEPLFRLGVECFEGYADGHNYLGLIALERGRLDEAITQFQRTVDVGRRRLPRRVARGDWWSVLETRPYMRGLRNLALALNRAGRWEEALAVCDRLESECGDRITAESHRASVYLNTGRFPEAAGAAIGLRQLDASESLVAALAQVETGQHRAALASLIHGALNSPRAVRMLAGLSTLRPKTATAARDHNTGVELLHVLHRYLRERRRSGPRFLAQALKAPAVQALLQRKQQLEKLHEDEVAARLPPPSDAFRKAREMETLAFAESVAARIADALGLPDAAPLLAVRRGRRRRPTIH